MAELALASDRITNKSNCVLCGDRFLCGATNERVKITLYGDRRADSVKEHCLKRNIRLSENIRVEGVKSEEDGRHQSLIPYIDEVIKKRKGTKLSRFEKGFYLGEIKYFIGEDKKQSKRQYNELRKANLVLPIRSFKEYKLTMMPDRPVADYASYVKGLMTIDPYHLSSKTNASQIYLFAVDPDSAVREAGMAIVANAKSVSGGGGLGGSGGGGASAGGANSNSGAQVGFSESSRGLKKSQATPRKAVLNDQGQWVANSAPSRMVANVPAVNSKSGKTTSLNLNKLSSTTSNLIPSQEKRQQQRAKDEKRLAELRYVDTSSLDRKTPFKLNSTKTKIPTRLDETDVELKTEETKESVLFSGRTVRRRAYRGSSDSVSVSTNENQGVNPEGKRADDDVDIDNEDSVATAYTKKEHGMSYANINCDDFRSHMLENYKNTKICGTTHMYYQKCEKDFRKSILEKCEALFNDKFPVEEDIAWVDAGNGSLTSIQRCTEHLERMTEMYMPKTKPGQIKTNLISSFYENDVVEGMEFKEWELVKKIVKKKSNWTYSNLFCSESAKIKNAVKNIKPRIVKLISIETGIKEIDILNRCESFFDKYAGSIMSKYENINVDSLRSKIVQEIYRYPLVKKSVKKTESAEELYVESKKLYKDLKLYVQRYELKSYIQTNSDPMIGVMVVVEDKLDANSGSSCGFEKKPIKGTASR